MVCDVPYRLPFNDTDSFLRYNPIQKYGPQDCVASINALIAKIDQLVASRNQAAIHDLKAVFGLESLADIRDFAMTIAFPRMYCNYQNFCICIG